MVLKVIDFTWTQSEECVFISVPLRGRKKAAVDVISTDNYVKVNFNPYFFECFLYENVDDKKSKMVFIEGVLIITLSKVKKLMWETLNCLLYDDKEVARRQRDIEVNKYLKKVQEADEEKKEQKAEGNKYSLREMMQLESRGKERIKNIKEKETMQAMSEVEDWKERKKCEAEKFRIEREKIKTQEERVQLAIKSSSQVQIKDDLFLIEPMRRSGKIEVTFTPRVFPTPERESVKEREEEWLKKQRDVAKIRADRVTGDMKAEEQNPEWLKDKGNSLFAVGDFSGALAAYTMALEISPDNHTCYSNRSACHIKLRNFFKAIEDATKAMELLNPPVMQNLSSRIKAHLRRGASFCNLEMYREGLLDYEAALKLDPENESIKRDIEGLKGL